LDTEWDADGCLQSDAIQCYDQFGVAKAKKKAAQPKRPLTPVVRMTQQDRLRAAVHTERENQLSLLKFQQKQDAQKKKTVENSFFLFFLFLFFSPFLSCLVPPPIPPDTHTRRHADTPTH